MKIETIQMWIQEHGELTLLAAGAVCLAGAIRNWNWLCDPSGTRDAQSPFGRGGRRLAFGTLGAAMLVIGVWLLVKGGR